MTFDEAKSNPEFKAWFPAIEFFEKNRGKILAPEKYILAQKSHIRQALNELIEGNPEATLKDAIIAAIQPLPDFVPDDMLKRLTRFAIEYWEKLKEESAVKLDSITA